MKEITRIHLAKVPYSIEIDAKRLLEKYLAELSAYADDTILEDVEQRLTELLADRHVLADDIIATADVAALQQQLGNPQDFADDANQAEGSLSSPTSSVRRLFRDRSQAWVGGVASGVGQYLGINPNWVRLALVVGAFASFGTMLLVYLVLWALVPSANTVSDRLQLAGQPVTLANLRKLGSATFNVGEDRERRLIRAAQLILGTGFVLSAVGALVATGVGVYYVLFTGQVINPEMSALSNIWPLYFGCGLLIASGLLFVLLMIVGAIAAFMHTFTKRIVVATITIIVIGLTTFGAGLGFIWTGHNAFQAAVQSHIKQITIPAPASFAAVTSLAVSAKAADVGYVVSSEPAKIVVSQMVYKGRAIEPSLTLNGTTARLSLDNTAPSLVCGNYCSPVTVTVYGPALTSLTAETGRTSYSNGLSAQAKLEISTKIGSNAVIDEGNIEALTLLLADNSEADVNAASIKQATITAGREAVFNLGTIQSLNLTVPTACPAGSRARGIIANISDGNLKLNGQVEAATERELPCASLSYTN